MWILYFCTACVFHWQFVTAVVTSGPSIESPSSVNEGLPILLSCSAVCSNGSCVFSWTGYSTNKNVLEIKKVTREHRNKSYTCSVKDLDNVPKTAKKSFEVYYGPDIVTIGAGSTLTVIEGEKSDNKDLVCSAKECNPTCNNNIHWSFKGRTVSNNTKLFVTNRAISRNDEGSYICNASNGKTDPKTKTIVLTVNYAPKVDLTWSEQRNELVCKATGKPAIYSFEKIKQYVGNTLVKSYEATVKGDTASLDLGAKNYMDSWRYVCTVSNGIKNLEAESMNRMDAETIFVEDKPLLVKAADSYNVSKDDQLSVEFLLYSYPADVEISIPGDNMSFKCNQRNGNITLTCETQPSLEIEVHKVDVTITSGQKLTLIFYKILEENFKTYPINISNSAGHILTNITIFPEGAPDTPTKFYKSGSSHDSLTFIIVTGFFNGGGQTVVVEHRLAGNQSSWSNSTLKFAGVEKNKQVELVVQDLSAETLYEFRAYAFNEYKSSAYTGIIKEETLEAPVAVGLIVGLVIVGVVILVIAVLVVGFVIKRRRQKKESDAGTFTSQNKDLTLEIPTTPGYENHHLNTYVKEPVTPDSLSNTILYENTAIGSGHITYEDQTTRAAKYDVPQSHAHYVNQSIRSYRDSPSISRNNNAAPYDVPRTQTTNTRENIGLYDTPRSEGAVGSYSNDVQQTDGAFPPYLEFANPDSVEEAYANLSDSKTSKERNGTKVKLIKQNSVLEEDYLDMSDLTGAVKLSAANKSHYNNTPSSETYENTEFSSNKKSKKETDGKDYQNVAKFKKEKVKKPFLDSNKKGEKKKTKNAEAAEDYENANRYKKGPKWQSSVDAQTDYVSMDTNSKRERVMSIPDYHAPAPPVQAAPPEEDYMNIRMGKS